MHPQLYLKTFWKMELKPTIFVAMSFSNQYQARFEKIIEPAINQITVNGVRLEADRVDISKSGDSILTDIMDGIAHSQMILADVSTIGKDSVSGDPIRNGNVMYEVGLALASRHSSEVLLVRDDKDKFLFDVSTIPHKHINFIDEEQAIVILKDELIARLRERNHVNDARVQLALSSLSNEEASALKYISRLPAGNVFGRDQKGNVDFNGMIAIPRLLDKQLIRLAGEFNQGQMAYVLTTLGKVIADLVATSLNKYEPDVVNNDSLS